MFRLLQWYVFREMSKTFLLTAAGLTILLSMGGGITKILQVEGASAVQMLKIMLVVVPSALTMSLPVAALFAAAMTFGRLSADNELNACRAVGVNVLWLLAPCVLMSLLVAAVTFYFSNFVIPGFFKRLDTLVRKDVQRIAERELRGRGSLGLQQKYRLHVDYVQEVPPPDPEPDAGYLHMVRGAFVQMERGSPVVVATARQIITRFSHSDSPTSVSAKLRGVRSYDLRRGQFIAVSEETLGPMQPPLTFPLKPKWLDLRELLYYREHTEDLPDVRNLLQGVRRKIRRHYFFQDLIRGLTEQYVVRLADERRRYEIRASRVQLARKEDQVRLADAQIVETAGPHRRHIKAKNASITITDRGRADQAPQIEIALFGGVSILDSQQPDQPVGFDSLDLAPVRMPQEVIQREAAVSDALILDVSRPLHLGPQVDFAREGLRRERTYLKYRIIGILHSRTALSLSVFVVVIFGAALGIVLRGGHVMTAFGISFAPSLFIIATIAMGRHVAENEATAAAGLTIIWGALAVMLLADALTLWKLVRR